MQTRSLVRLDVHRGTIAVGVAAGLLGKGFETRFSDKFRQLSIDEEGPGLKNLDMGTSTFGTWTRLQLECHLRKTDAVVLLFCPRSPSLLCMAVPRKRALAFTEILQDDSTFVLRVVQPGLAGLMDGSVSTLAPIFATAFATHKSHTAFLIGMAAAVGAGISMAFAEGLSDSGELTGRGKPVLRGVITGLMTFLGGFLHTLPFLLGSVRLALDVAYFVVGVELLTISWIRYRYMRTSFLRSCLQVLVGGGLVFAAGALIGQS